MDQKIKQELDELSYWYNRKQIKNGGRPKVWTDDVIDAFAEELLDWAEKEDSLVLSGFTSSQRYCTPILNKLAAISPNFRWALNEAKRVLGVRRETGTVHKKFEPKVFAMTARMYDPELCDHLSAVLAKEELIKAKAKVKALNQELKSKGEIITYLEAQKVLKEVTE